MKRAEYHALRRAAYVAKKAASDEILDDGRSSYASHGIRVNSAIRAASAAEHRVPRDRGNALETVRRINRRRRVIACIRERNHARTHTPSCLPFYQRQLHDALHCLDLENRHV